MHRVSIEYHMASASIDTNPQNDYVGNRKIEMLMIRAKTVIYWSISSETIVHLKKIILIITENLSELTDSNTKNSQTCTQRNMHNI